MAARIALPTRNLLFVEIEEANEIPMAMALQTGPYHSAAEQGRGGKARRRYPWHIVVCNSSDTSVVSANWGWVP